MGAVKQEPRLDIMLDLETLSTAKNAAVIQVGMCVFDIFDPEHPLKYPLYDARIQVRPDFDRATVDPNTLAWWLRQESKARLQVETALTQGLSEEGAISAVMDVMGTIRRDLGTANTFVWSKGPDFDMAILASLFARQGSNLNRVFDYRAARDVRTLFDLYGWAPEVDWDWHGWVAHDALCDAKGQAVQAAQAFRYLRDSAGKCR